MKIEELIRHLRSATRGSVSRSHQSRYGTSDVTQSAVVQIISMPDFKSRLNSYTPAQTRAWLRKIGRGNVAKLYRQNEAQCRSVQREVDDAEGHRVENSPEDIAMLQEAKTRLIVAISQLDSQERMVVEKHYRDGLSLAEIAKTEGKSAKQVQRIHRKLIKTLGEKMELPLGSDNE